MSRLATFLCILSASLSVLAAEGGIGSDAAFERSLHEISVASLDVERLRERVRLRSPAANESQIDRLIERNLHFIYRNKLNRQRFLVAPDPQSVVDRIVVVLELNQRIGTLILDGRRLIGTEDPGPPADMLVREVGSAARELKRAFGGYFLEGHSSSYSLELPVSRDVPTQMAHFLIQSGRITNELTQRLDDYFFTSLPQAVSLETYRSTSVATLADSLQRLSDLVGKRLPRSGGRDSD
jgi:hypothetical protein